LEQWEQPTEYFPVEGINLTDSDSNDRWDWRDYGYMSGVKDQGQCGSCWAFATTATTESAWAQKTLQLYTFSEQQLVDCSRAYGNNGCGGGWHASAMSYIAAYGI